MQGDKSELLFGGEIQGDNKTFFYYYFFDSKHGIAAESLHSTHPRANIHM